MTPSHREFVLDLLSGIGWSQYVPESLADEEEAIDWLFYLLLDEEYPASELIGFLGKHHSTDHRFKLWTQRAFRPGLGEDGMMSESAFAYLERSSPDHPWLNVFTQQAAYSFACGIDSMFLGKDFSSHLRKRYPKQGGDHRKVTELSQSIAVMATMDLETIAEDASAAFDSRLAALEELARRQQFGCFFRTNLPYESRNVLVEEAKALRSPALRSAAQNALQATGNPALAIEVLLAQDISVSEFADLLQFASRTRPNLSCFLRKIMDPDCGFPEESIRSMVMGITREDTNCRYNSIPFLLSRFPQDQEVIELIKSCAAAESDAYRFSQILSWLLDYGIESEWVRASVLAYRDTHDECRHTIRLLARIGDPAHTQTVLDAFESPIREEQSAAIESAAKHLHHLPEVRSALMEQARKGNTRACRCIIRRYPEDPNSSAILRTHLKGPQSRQYHGLIPLMCAQGIMLAEIRGLFIRSITSSSWPYGSPYNAILAIRSEREALRDEISLHWEKLLFQRYERTSPYLMWYPLQPLIGRIKEILRSGDHVGHARELLLAICGQADLAEALRSGILAAAPHKNNSDAILLLGLIYGDRPETPKFMEDYVRLDPAQRKHGSEVAFAEALRLGKRDKAAFDWAVDAMATSSQRKDDGLAGNGPGLFAHFFGLGTEVRDVLGIFTHSDTNPVLADSSRALLMEKFSDTMPDLSRAAVSAMPVDRRIKHLRHVARITPLPVQEIKHFALHDPAAEVRKAAMQIVGSLYWRTSPPPEWTLDKFAIECIKDGELANQAAGLLARIRPQDEWVAHQILAVHARFPETGVILPLAQSYGEIPEVRFAVYQVVTRLQQIVPPPDARPGCKCKGCIGYDIQIYSALTVCLHSPPFREEEIAAILRKGTFRNPNIETFATSGILKAETQALEASQRSQFLDQIARSDAHLNFRKTACGLLAQMAEKEDEPLEWLLAMMRGDNIELKDLAKESCRSIGLNSRRSHRALQTLLKS